MQSNGTYRLDIDGLRAIAVLSVMIYHLHPAWLPGGFVGVDVFFVISGFVVTGSLAHSKADSIASFINEFYARRLARILPALVVVLIFSAFAATAFIPPVWLSELGDTTAKHAFFGLSNWVLQRNSDTYFAPRAEFNPFTHTWSLGVEEQFYVLAPLLVYVWVRAVRLSSGVDARIAVGGLSLLTVASIAGCLWASKADPAAAFYFIGCRLWELSLGSLLYLITWPPMAEKAVTGPKSVLRRASSMTGLACIAASLVYADSAQFPWPWALVPVTGTLLLISGVRVDGADLVRRALAAPPAVWIGKRSYSLYLWHWPVYVLLRWTVGLEDVFVLASAVVASFILANGSYRWVEQPLRHNPWIESRPKWMRIAGFLMLPLVGYVIAKHVFEHRHLYSQSAVAHSQGDWIVEERLPSPNALADRNCQAQMTAHPIAGGLEKRYSPQQCVGKTSTKKIYVLGDSHARALFPIFEQLSAEKGVPISAFILPGCGYIDLQSPMDAKRPANCLAFNREVTRQVLASAKPGDIVFLPSLRMKRYSDQWASFNVADMAAQVYKPEAIQSRKAAFEDAKSWLQPFADKHLEVLFFAPPPILKGPAFRCSDWFNQMNPICAGLNQQPRAELEALRKPVVESMQALRQIYPNVRIWDAFPLLCTGEFCRTHSQGRPLFFDGDHLSAYGNLVIYPAFRQIMLEAR
jgi:peptidoglycan/LPS O-acetylase OafA/YrhL